MNDTEVAGLSSAVSRLHTTVRNLSFLPRYSSSTPICRNGGFHRRASQRSKYRRSMPRTVLSARPIRRATCRAEALSQDSPTASSNRLLYGDLLGNCGTFSAFTKHAGQSTRYSSTTTPPRHLPRRGALTGLPHRVL